MRRAFLIGLSLLCTAAFSCGRITEAPRTAHLQVFVHFDDQALAGRKLEILELATVRTTDQNGTAEFELPAGIYTLRTYVNAGGPAGYRDVSVSVTEGRTTRVDVFDCLPCMSAT